MRERRPEIISLYESSIFGAIPANTPKVTWQVTETDPAARDGKAVKKRIVGKIGTAADAPTINVTSVHAGTRGQAGANHPAREFRQQFDASASDGRSCRAAPPPDRSPRGGGDPRTWLGLRDGRIPGHPAGQDRHVQSRGDRYDARSGKTAPGPDEWGAIGAWSWGVSRILDYLVTDRRSTRSTSRCSGTRGSARRRCGRLRSTSGSPPSTRAARARWEPRCRGATLARRSTTWRRTFPTGSPAIFRSGSGRWNEMPVDAHMLIALSAPRPVFITGGTQDQWADPVGEFKAEVAAGPVYRATRQEGSRRHRPAAARHARHRRRSRLALSHRRPRGDAGRLEGVPAVPGEVLQVVRPEVFQHEARRSVCRRRPLAVHSCRKATTGSTRAARLAGIQHARLATTIRRRGTDAEDDPRRWNRSS